MRRDACKSCGAPIYWAAHTTTGRPAPIDAAPMPGGNLEIAETLGGGLVYYVVPRAERVRYTVLYTNHFMRCPAAADWHGRRRGADRH